MASLQGINQSLQRNYSTVYACLSENSWIFRCLEFPPTSLWMHDLGDKSLARKKSLFKTMQLTFLLNLTLFHSTILITSSIAFKYFCMINYFGLGKHCYSNSKRLLAFFIYVEKLFYQINFATLICEMATDTVADPFHTCGIWLGQWGMIRLLSQIRAAKNHGVFEVVRHIDE